MNKIAVDRSIILQVVLLLFVERICSNDSILSKMSQHGYKLKDVRIEVFRYNKSYCSRCEIKPFKYNRTTTAHNATVNFKIDFEDKLEVITQAYKFLSNEYRYFPLRFQVNLKKCFDTNAMGLAELTKCGNITTMTFYKDITYHACNFLIDESHFPPLIPNGKYRLEFTILYLNQEDGIIYMYNEVYTPMAYPK